MYLTLSRETIGTFIDAVYAIAVTILALEVPGQFSEGFSVVAFMELLVEYALSFFILFALWVQHRRINDLNGDKVSSTVIWLNCLVLLLVCLVPHATTLIFSYGDDVTLVQFEAILNHGAEWTISEFVDMLYIALIIGAELGLLVMVVIVSGGLGNDEAMRIHRSKLIVTICTVVVLLLSLVLPVQNRYFLVFIPMTLLFERHLTQLMYRQS